MSASLQESAKIWSVPHLKGLNLLRATFVMIFEANHEQIQQIYDDAMSNGMVFSIFTEDLFKTGNDIDNRAAVKSRTREELRLVGIAIHDRKKRVDKILKGVPLHK